MARSALPYGALVVAAGLLATCGGGDGSDSSSGADSGGTNDSGGSGAPQDQTTTVTCDSLAPSDCGGDVAGSWSLDSVCGATTRISVGDYLPAECAGTFVELEPAASTGTLTFSDGSFTTTATLNFAASTTLYSGCIQAMAAGEDVGLVCPAVGPSFAAWGIDATCALDADDCRCDGPYSETLSEAGTYTVSGDQLTLTPASSAEEPEPETTTFCARSGYLIVELEPLVSGGQPFHLVLEKR